MPRIKKQYLIPLIILLLLVVGLVVYFLFLRKEKGPRLTAVRTPTIKSQNPALKDVTIEKIIFAEDFVFPEIPSSLPLAQVAVQEVSIKLLGQKLAQIFNLQQVEGSDFLWSDANNTQNLIVDVEHKDLNYSVDGFNKPEAYEGAYPPSKEKAMEAAEVFVKLIPEWKNYQASDNVTYLQVAGPEALVTSAEKADLINVSLSPKISNYSLVNPSQSYSQISVTIGQQNQVVKVQAQNKVLVISSQLEDYPLISPEKAMEEISFGKGTVYNVTTAYQPIIDPLKTIAFTSISDVWIEYQVDSRTNTALPYFVFKGLSTLETGTTVNVFILFPAIDPQYLK